jgi:hypothetical protein
VRRISHGGSWAGFRAHFARYPEYRVATTVLCNLASAGPTALAESVAWILLAGNMAPAGVRRLPGTPALAPGSSGPDVRMLRRIVPDGIAGRYRSDELLSDWIVTVRGDTVFARPGLGAEFALGQVHPDTFSAFGNRIAVVRSGGRVAGLSLTSRGLVNLRLQKVEP